jgi:hypothetical protein
MTALPTRVVVLLEGHSDAVAVRVLCRRAGLPVESDALVLRDMHGVTNVGRHLREIEPGDRVLGLCDFAERRFVARALRAGGRTVESDDDLPRWGFEVCDRDLEDELVRALGPERVLEVLRDLGELGRFAPSSGSRSGVTGTSMTSSDGSPGPTRAARRCWPNV